MVNVEILGQGVRQGPRPRLGPGPQLGPRGSGDLEHGRTALIGVARIGAMVEEQRRQLRPAHLAARPERRHAFVVCAVHLWVEKAGATI